jgi:mono/diheme cytochrome c family protein
MEQNYIRIYRLLTMIFSSLLIILILSAWIRENFFGEWRRYQHEFRKISKTDEVDKSVVKDMLRIEIGIRELDLRDLNRVDRCISCHLGIEDPGLVNFSQPHAGHSGNFIINHPPNKFGCTVCHSGQGRAVSLEEAFGREEQTHWLFPLLDQPYIQSSCGKCHLVLFGEDYELNETETLMKGQKIFNREGCLGCHRARGVGGTVGPDLTQQGEKTRHEYNFQNIKGEQTVSNWLREHFHDPEIVSPGSQMLKMNLKEDEIEALVTFTLALAKPDIPFEYFSIGTLKEHKGARNFIKGKNLYQYCCSACHGKAREGKNFQEYETGVPSLGNRDFLSVASGSFIRFTIYNGRSWRQMASWLPEFSGLSNSEIDSAVNFIRRGKEVNSSFTETNKIDGNIKNGKALYNLKCNMCHGNNLEGTIGLPLNNQDFLKTASDRFIYNTISKGRYNTAMPSWSYLNSMEIADIITYIRSEGIEYSPYLYYQRPVGDIQQGATQFHYLCSRCHGANGEGETGPAILNPDFLKTADNLFLYTTIAFGRKHTAMFGWRGQLTAQGEIGDKHIYDVIAFMEAACNKKWDYIYPGANPGNSSEGSDLYRNHCSVCHGENGSGIKAPQLNNQEFLNAATNGYIIATISLGREGTNMPSWGEGNDQYPQLSNKQRQDITSYIRSWQKINIKYNR